MTDELKKSELGAEKLFVTTFRGLHGNTEEVDRNGGRVGHGSNSEADSGSQGDYTRRPSEEITIASRI